MANTHDLEVFDLTSVTSVAKCSNSARESFQPSVFVFVDVKRVVVSKSALAWK